MSPSESPTSRDTRLGLSEAVESQTDEIMALKEKLTEAQKLNQSLRTEMLSG